MQRNFRLTHIFFRILRNQIEFRKLEYISGCQSAEGNPEAAVFHVIIMRLINRTEVSWRQRCVIRYFVQNDPLTAGLPGFQFPVFRIATRIHLCIAGGNQSVATGSYIILCLKFQGPCVIAVGKRKTPFCVRVSVKQKIISLVFKSCIIRILRLDGYIPLICCSVEPPGIKCNPSGDLIALIVIGSAAVLFVVPADEKVSLPRIDCFRRCKLTADCP